MSGDGSELVDRLMRSDSFGLLPPPFLRILGTLGRAGVILSETAEAVETPVCERAL